MKRVLAIIGILTAGAIGGAAQGNPPPALLYTISGGALTLAPASGQAAPGGNPPAMLCETLTNTGQLQYCSFSGGGGMVYPGAGIANSPGTSGPWGTSYSASNLIPANFLSLPIVVPESYGAVGNGYIYFDGAIASSASLPQIGLHNTAPTAPAVTTNHNSEMVLSIYEMTAVFSSNPSGTSRLSAGYISNSYGAYVYDQTVATAGSVSANAGATSGNAWWNAATISLQPASGQTITFDARASTQPTSGTSISVNTPAGLTNGEWFMTCLDYFNGVSSSTITFPSALLTGATRLAAVTNSDKDSMVCFGKFANNEPSSYTFTQSSGDGAAAFTISYKNVANTDGAVLTSATAGFTSGEIGDPICVANTSTPAQICGVIAAYNSATSIDVSTAATNSASSMQVVFGTDDYSALNTMLTTAPCSTVGCWANLSAKNYISSKPLTVPATTSIRITGVAPGATNTSNNYINSNALLNYNGGSRITFVSQAMSGAGITASTGSTTLTSTGGMFTLEHLSLVGRAGRGRDGGGLGGTFSTIGGGADGLDIFNWQQAEVNDVFIYNFAGHGAYVDGLAASTVQSYIQGAYFDKFFSFWNGGSGIKVGSTLGVDDVEQAIVSDSTFENNGGPGVWLSGPTVQGFVLQGSVVQWDNVYAANPELVTTNASGGSFGGCEVRGNYFEVNGTLSSLSNNYATPETNTGVHYCNYGSNFVPGVGSGMSNCSPSGQCGATTFISNISTLTGATPAIVAYNGDFTITLSANATPTIGTFQAGTVLRAQICQPASGGPYTWTWPTAMHGGATIGTSASTCTMQTFESFNGTTMVAIDAGVTGVAP